MIQIVFRLFLEIEWQFLMGFWLILAMVMGHRAHNIERPKNKTKTTTNLNCILPLYLHRVNGHKKFFLRVNKLHCLMPNEKTVNVELKLCGDSTLARWTVRIALIFQKKNKLFQRFLCTWNYAFVKDQKKTGGKNGWQSRKFPRARAQWHIFYLSGGDNKCAIWIRCILSKRIQADQWAWVYLIF